MIFHIYLCQSDQKTKKSAVIRMQKVKKGGKYQAVSIFQDLYNLYAKCAFLHHSMN
jgi:hypothetical protein